MLNKIPYKVFAGLVFLIPVLYLVYIGQVKKESKQAMMELYAPTLIVPVEIELTPEQEASSKLMPSDQKEEYQEIISQRRQVNTLNNKAKNKLEALVNEERKFSKLDEKAERIIKELKVLVNGGEDVK